MRRPLVSAAMVGVASLCCVSAFARSTPLTLSYSITPELGGVFRYQFRMTLDNHDGTWAPGQGWGWVVYADAYYSPSPMDDFQGNPLDLPIGPWDEYTTSEGEHNGPTLGFLLNMWSPVFIGESITWSGHSTVRATPGSLTWSSLVTTGGASTFQYAPAVEEGTGCPADFDHDAFVTGDDFDGFVAAFEAGTSPADFDRDGFVTGDDFDAYVVAFEAGC